MAGFMQGSSLIFSTKLPLEYMLTLAGPFCTTTKCVQLFTAKKTLVVIPFPAVVIFLYDMTAFPLVIRPKSKPKP